MKIHLKLGTIKDLDSVYDLHRKCFQEGDLWYKSIMGQYIDNSLILELIDSNKIIGFLLQGKINILNNSDNLIFDNMNIENTSDNTIDNKFIFINNDYSNKIDLKKKYNAILLVCIDPDYRSKGLGKKLINNFISMNNNEISILHTRMSNYKAQKLYKDIGYISLGILKNNCIHPTEDSMVMIKYD